MMRLFICLFALVASVVLAQKSGDVCSYDSICDYRCCSYAEEYHKNGTCVEIDDWPRCKDRKHRHHIILYCFLSVIVVTAAVCVLMKKKETSSKRAAL